MAGPDDMPAGSSRRPPDRAQFRTFAQLGLGMAVFGSATPISKIVTAAAPVFIGSGIRVALGALTLLPIFLLDPRKRALVRELTLRDWVVIGLIAVFGMFGFSALMLYGMRMVSGVAGAVIMSTTPAVTAAAAVVFMNERPTWRKSTAIVLAVTGVLVLELGSRGSGDGEPGSWMGVTLVFGAVCCEACYTLLGKLVSERTDPMVVAFLGALLSIPLFVPFAIWQWTQFDPGAIDVRSWSAIVWYGAGTLALGSWLWYSGVAKVSGTVAAGFMVVMPVSALVLSYVLLGEVFAWIHLLGFAIALSGVILVSWEHARMSSH